MTVYDTGDTPATLSPVRYCYDMNDHHFHHTDDPSAHGDSGHKVQSASLQRRIREKIYLLISLASVCRAPQGRSTLEISELDCPSGSPPNRRRIERCQSLLNKLGIRPSIEETA